MPLLSLDATRGTEGKILEMPNNFLYVRATLRVEPVVDQAERGGSVLSDLLAQRAAVRLRPCERARDEVGIRESDHHVAIRPQRSFSMSLKKTVAIGMLGPSLDGGSRTSMCIVIAHTPSASLTSASATVARCSSVSCLASSRTVPVLARASASARTVSPGSTAHSAVQ